MRTASDLLDIMESLNWGNGIIREMIDNGISKDVIRNIVVDFILAAGDTVRYSYFEVYQIFKKYTPINSLASNFLI